MISITMRSFMNAIISGELVINYKNEQDKVAQKTVPAIVDGKMSDEMIQFATEQIEKLDKKNSSKKEGGRLTAKQIENEGLKNQILERMEAGTAYTSKDIVAFEIIGVTSPQKVSSLMKGLIAEGKVEAKDGRTKQYTRIGFVSAVDAPAQEESESEDVPF